MKPIYERGKPLLTDSMKIDFLPFPQVAIVFKPESHVDNRIRTLERQRIDQTLTVRRGKCGC